MQQNNDVNECGTSALQVTEANGAGCRLTLTESITLYFFKQDDMTNWLVMVACWCCGCHTGIHQVSLSEADQRNGCYLVYHSCVLGNLLEWSLGTDGRSATPHFISHLNISSCFVQSFTNTKSTYAHYMYFPASRIHFSLYFKCGWLH